MALTSDEVSSTKNDEADSSSSENIISPSTITDEEQNLSSNNSNYVENENLNKKSRSVSFAPTVQEYEIPSNRHHRQPTDFIDALVDSYKLEISSNLFPLKEDKPYIRRTTRTRVNPNWREHRVRHLMNKLEELTLWDREEELKKSQEKFLREQKFEQIQDRQRNHNLCLSLMRQRHENEMESAVLLDRPSNFLNNENTRATIDQTMRLTSPNVRKRQTNFLNPKTPIGRYRQFENEMSLKVDKINQKIRPNWRLTSAHRTVIPPTVVPLFSETYTALLSVPDFYSTNKYHYRTGSHLRNASSPDYELRQRSHLNRDVRVPFDDYNSDDNENDKNNYSQRSTKNNSNQQKYDDDLNAIRKFSNETTNKILQQIFDSTPNTKRVQFNDDEE